MSKTTMRTYVATFSTAALVLGSFFFALSVADAQAVPTVTLFTLTPSSIQNAYSTLVSWSINSSSGGDIMFTCPSGVTMKRDDGSVFPCGSRQSLSRATDSFGLTFYNISGVPRTVNVRLYPKDTSGNAYDAGYVDANLTVGTAYETISSFTASSISVISGNALTLTWQGLYISNTNIRFDCTTGLTVRDQSGNVLPCGVPAFSSDLGPSGAHTFTLENTSGNTVSLAATILPVIAAGSYDGGHSRSITAEVKPPVALPDPTVKSFGVDAKTVVSGGTASFIYETTFASSTNFQFSCADVTLTSGSTTLPCNVPVFSPPLAASGKTAITFTNRGYSPQTVRTTLLTQKGNGTYFYGSSLQNIEITVLGMGQSLPPIQAIPFTSTSVIGGSGAAKPVSSSTYTFTAALRRGLKHADVTALQKFLAKDSALYPEGLATGFFGPATEAAVKRFQKKYGIEQTGTIGPMTRAKLNSLTTP